MASGWQPLDPESLVAAPCLIEQTLCQQTDQNAQLAKDLDYAKAVLEKWKDDEDFSWRAVWKPVVYQDKSSPQTNLHGYCIRKQVHQDADVDKKVPGVVFFHTGAGPHDLFLLFKAVSLVNSVDEKDMVVFIADILGDESGWAWDGDRTRYNLAREKVLAVRKDGNGGISRPLLQKRITSAFGHLSSHESVDRFAAFGWCLGGHSILEISRMQSLRPQIKAAATFHGVFDGMSPPPQDVAPADFSSRSAVDVLICHGTEDPFVSPESLESALATFQAYGCRTSLLQLPAKHGFTNPAQDFNPNPAFAFHPDAASKAWQQAVNLVKTTLW
jgi:dienelactone hydrolase